MSSPHANATVETTQFVYWKSNVLDIVCSATGRGIGELPAEWVDKLPLWFRTGETVQQAADSLVSVCKIRSRKLVEYTSPARLALSITRVRA